MTDNRKICPYCNKYVGELPKGTLPEDRVQLYHMPCAEKRVDKVDKQPVEPLECRICGNAIEKIGESVQGYVLHYQCVYCKTLSDRAKVK